MKDVKDLRLRPFNAIELKILKGIINEKTSKEIAQNLGYSVRTVEGYRRNMTKKANAKTVVGLVTYSIINRLIILPRFKHTKRKK